MKNEGKIHLLAQELIPVMKDLDDEPQKIVLDHIKNCADCKHLYTAALEFDKRMPTLDYSEEVELKPLKKLTQFNTGLKLLLITIRAIILFYIFYSNFRLASMDLADVSFIESSIFLFYTPAAIFLLVFTFTFFNKKWLWASFITDLFIVLFLGKILHFFL